MPLPSSVLKYEPLLQPALGKQALSTRASAPISGFGSTKRPGMAVLRNVPGPGAYKLKPTIGEPHNCQHLRTRSIMLLACDRQVKWPLRTGGEQVDSTKASAATVHFAAATRDAADKIFISLEHEKAVYGRGSPGMSGVTSPVSSRAALVGTALT